MVATLVVVLPCSYTGGALHVRHGGQEKIIDFSKTAADLDIHYADCEHEVKPLTSGYRLCLVYNLILTKAKQQITAPRTQDQISELSKVLHRWRTTKYTVEGLSWSNLKGADHAKAHVPRQFSQARLYLHMLNLGRYAVLTSLCHLAIKLKEYVCTPECGTLGSSHIQHQGYF
jgi:hypothetical protein